MPNAKLSPSVKQDIVKYAFAVATNLVSLAERTPPLTFAQVVKLANPDDEMLALAERMKAAGYSIGTTRGLKYNVPARDGGRDAALFIELNAEIITARPSFGWAHGGTGKWPPDAHPVDFAGVCGDAVHEWVDKAVKARRQRALVCYTVDEFLSACESSYHIHASWPGLAAVFIRREPRLASKPNRPGAYMLTLPEATRKRMALCDHILSKAMVVGEQKDKELVDGVKCSAAAWHMKPGDLV